MANNIGDRKHEKKFSIRFATFIVDKRNLFFFIFIVLCVFSVFSFSWVRVENELSAFLDDDSETKQGLKIMEEEFITYGMANIMIANISYEQADAISKQMEKLKGVFSVMFDNSKKHYNNASALFNVTFNCEESDDECIDSLDNLLKEFEEYDIYVDTTVGDLFVDTITKEVAIISIYVGILVVAVLLFTSQSYGEVPVMLITFLSAALINMGTNFFFGTISFVSNSVAIVLQLALSIDYAIILIHRFKEERIKLPAKEAVVQALSKAILEISASSLTTICGLLAMTFMQFKIGFDMGIVLIKSIFISLASVFILMPGVLFVFSNLIDKTAHRNFVPKVSFIGKFAYSTRKIIPPIFVVILLFSIYFSGKCPYVYGYDLLKTKKQNELQVTQGMIQESFASENPLALVIPAGNYDSEARLLAELETYDEIDYAMGLANIEAMEGYMLVDGLTPREFSELTDIDYEVSKLLYAAYAIRDESYGKVVSGLDMYGVPLLDMFLFLYDQVQEGFVSLDQELEEMLDEAYSQMNSAKQQMQGENYSRLMVSLNLPEEGEETFRFLDKIHEIAGKYYKGGVFLVGESTSHYDQDKAFSNDNTLISILTIAFVITILLFTFKSVALPIFLIMVIQGSIWINFSFPYIMGSNVLFMVYLIASAIQMGANIDYAIVISNRFLELKNQMSRKEAIIETMNQSFPTLITSGSMMAASGILIGTMTSDPAIAGMGESLGRGTIISLILVIFVLPQILLVGNRLIEKTSFTIKSFMRTHDSKGTVYVNGQIRGQVSGTIMGNLRGIIRGDVSATVESGEMKLLSPEVDYQEEDKEVQDEKE